MALVSLKSNLSIINSTTYHNDLNKSIHSVEKLSQDNTHFTEHTLFDTGLIKIYNSSVSIHASNDGLTHKIDDVVHIAAGSIRRGFTGNIPSLGLFGTGQAYNNALLGIVSPLINITGAQTFPDNHITIGAVGSSIASPSPEPSNATIFKSQTFNVRDITITGDKIFEQKIDEDWLDKYYNQALNEENALGYKNKFHNPTDLLSGGHPIIIRKVGQRWGIGEGNSVIDQISSGFIRGGLITAAGRTEADIERIKKYLSSGKGQLFLAKQTILNLFNARNEVKLYNPLSVISSLVPSVHEDRHTSLFGVFYEGRYIKTKSVLDLKKVRNIGDESSPNYTGIDTENFKESVVEIGNILFKKASSIAGLGSKYVTDLSDKVNLIPYGSGPNGVAPTIQGQTVEELDFIPFKIKDLTNSKWLIFRAILGAINDSITADWNEYKYIGRPDKMWTYQGATRTVSFTLQIFPKTRQELPVLYDKVNYLIGLCYPHWSGKGSNQRMTSPFIELTMGNLWKKTPGFFNSVNITINDNSPWEIADSFQLPKHLEIALDFTYIGNYLPNAQGKHYELDWLVDKSGDGSGTFFDDRPWRGGTGPKGTKVDLNELFMELSSNPDDVVGRNILKAKKKIKDTRKKLKTGFKSITGG